MSTAVSETAAQASLEIRDPARGEVLGSVRATQPERVAEVVRAVAKVQPLWALLRVSDRARYMRRMAQAVIDDFDELARSIARARRSRRSPPAPCGACSGLCRTRAAAPTAAAPWPPLAPPPGPGRGAWRERCRGPLPAPGR